MTNREKARLYFLENDERCRVWESNNITWCLHHKDPSWQYNDPERYAQWNIEDLLPMTKTAHTVIHMTGKNNPMYGKSLSEETRRKISESHTGEKHHMYGKRHSEETKLKMRNTKLGKHMSEEAKQHMRDSHPDQHGENGHFYGRHHSNETRKKMSEAHKGNTASKGMHWYNNGITQTQSYECPEGFVPGRLTKGSHWYNNGITEIHGKECPEGFVPGRLIKE